MENPLRGVSHGRLSLWATARVYPGASLPSAPYRIEDTYLQKSSAAAVPIKSAADEAARECAYPLHAPGISSDASTTSRPNTIADPNSFSRSTGIREPGLCGSSACAVSPTRKNSDNKEVATDNMLRYFPATAVAVLSRCLGTTNFIPHITLLGGNLLPTLTGELVYDIVRDVLYRHCKTQSVTAEKKGGISATQACRRESKEATGEHTAATVAATLTKTPTQNVSQTTLAELAAPECTHTARRGTDGAAADVPERSEKKRKTAPTEKEEEGEGGPSGRQELRVETSKRNTASHLVSAERGGAVASAEDDTTTLITPFFVRLDDVVVGPTKNPFQCIYALVRQSVSADTQKRKHTKKEKQPHSSLSISATHSSNSSVTSYTTSGLPEVASHTKTSASSAENIDVPHIDTVTSSAASTELPRHAPDTTTEDTTAARPAAISFGGTTTATAPSSEAPAPVQQQQERLPKSYVSSTGVAASSAGTAASSAGTTASSGGGAPSSAVATGLFSADEEIFKEALLPLLHRRLKKALFDDFGVTYAEGASGHKYMPHVSLVYGDTTEFTFERRRTIVNALQAARHQQTGREPQQQVQQEQQQQRSDGYNKPTGVVAEAVREGKAALEGGNGPARWSVPPVTPREGGGPAEHDGATVLAAENRKEQHIRISQDNASTEACSRHPGSSCGNIKTKDSNSSSGTSDTSRSTIPTTTVCTGRAARSTSSYGSGAREGEEEIQDSSGRNSCRDALDRITKLEILLSQLDQCVRFSAEWESCLSHIAREYIGPIKDTVLYIESVDIVETDLTNVEDACNWKILASIPLPSSCSVASV